MKADIPLAKKAQGQSLSQNRIQADLPYLVALAAAPGIGPAKTKILLDFFKSAQEVWGSRDKDLLEILGKSEGERFLEYRKGIDVATNFEGLSRWGIRVITLLEDNYPVSLRQISSPPPVLYYKGDLDASLLRPCLAVVGTRMVSLYGREVTARLVSGLASAGLTIVSGLAKGVDSIAHQTTIEASGQTIAVLGGGLERVYPTQNIALAQKIVSGYGAVISEFPPLMDSVPSNFPARNRIISGLCLGVLVTEAAEDSGSLITATFAAEQGRDVFAVPGPITSRLSAGPSKLIKMGAKLVSGVEDILEELNLELRIENYAKKDYQPENEVEAKLLTLLDEQSQSIDQLVRDSGLSTASVSATLTLLEIKGVLRHLGTGVYTRK